MKWSSQIKLEMELTNETLNGAHKLNMKWSSQMKHEMELTNET